MYKYKINPVRGTILKHGENCELSDINDSCYGICAAFSGTTNVFEADPVCREQCDAFIEKRKEEKYGVGSCDHQAPYYPVIWNQTPRYFPELLKKTSPEKSLRMCKELCSKYNGNLEKSCQDSCLMDYNSVQGSKLGPELRSDLGRGAPNSPVREKETRKESKKGVIISLIVLLLFIISITYITFYKPF